MTSVAVVIVTFNRKAQLLESLTALERQRPASGVPYDIVVFDNDSTDGTEASVRARWPLIQYYSSPINLGGAGGFQRGMQIAYEAGYRYIWCLDDDGVPQPGALEELMQFAEAQGGWCLLGTRIVPADGSSDTFWQVVGPYDVRRKAAVRLTTAETETIRREGLPYPTCTVAMLGLFVSRLVIERIGYPDARLFVSNDDVEYSLRAWTRGVPVYQVPRAVVRHPPLSVLRVRLGRHQRAFIRMAPWKLYYYTRNIIAVNRHYFARTQFVRMVLGTVATVATNAFSSGSTGAALAAGVRGFRDGWRLKLDG